MIPQKNAIDIISPTQLVFRNCLKNVKNHKLLNFRYISENMKNFHSRHLTISFTIVTKRIL